MDTIAFDERLLPPDLADLTARDHIANRFRARGESATMRRSSITRTCR